ncbi:MAG: tRNA-dependent cyclodipeptide synthase [archaeon]
MSADKETPVGGSKEGCSVEDILTGLSIHNGDFADFSGRKNNVWLGVSISLKPYSEELARKYLKTAVQCSRERALVLIADEIASINYRVLGGYSDRKSLEKALERGDSFAERYRKFVGELLPADRCRVEVVRWRDVWEGQQRERYEVLKEEYFSNPDFRDVVESPVITYLANSARTIKPSRVDKMADYILRELPSLLEGVEYKGMQYKTMFYPTYGKTSLGRVVEGIQRGELFHGLKEKLGLTGDHVLVDSLIPGSGKGVLDGC